MGNKGRKIGSCGEQSRKLLLTIAAEEFAQNGYYETKISTIVQQAEVTQPTFYLYFKSKEEIFQVLVDTFRTRLIELIEQSKLDADLMDTDLSAKIENGITEILNFFKTDPNLTEIGLYIAPEANKVKELLTQEIANNLFEEQKMGYFRSDADMDFAAECVMGIIVQVTQTKLLSGEKEAKILAAEIVNLVFRGLHM